MRVYKFPKQLEFKFIRGKDNRMIFVVWNPVYPKNIPTFLVLMAIFNFVFVINK